MRNYKIIASLAYGKKYPIGFLVFLILALLLATALMLLSIICAILYAEYAALAALVLPFIVIPAFLCLIVLISKENKDIKKWEEDAVLLSAQAIEAGSIRNPFFGRTKFKIAIKFIFDGRKIVQDSEKENKRKKSIWVNMYPGYDEVFRKFIGRSIQILYSPKYEKVLLIKN